MYNNGKFVSCSKSVYKVDKITFDEYNSTYDYKYEDALIKTIENNEKIKTIIHNKDVNIIKDYKNLLYYTEDDYLYRYEPKSGNEKILYYFELNFNKDNTIFIYNK